MYTLLLKGGHGGKGTVDGKYGLGHSTSVSHSATPRPKPALILTLGALLIVAGCKSESNAPAPVVTAREVAAGASFAGTLPGSFLDSVAVVKAQLKDEAVITIYCYDAEVQCHFPGAKPGQWGCTRHLDTNEDGAWDTDSMLYGVEAENWVVRCLREAP